MKYSNKKNYHLLLLALLIILNTVFIPRLFPQNIFNQTHVLKNPFIYNCSFDPAPGINTGPSQMGYLKPTVTDFEAPPDAYFPVLVVFVQFANDPAPDCSWWTKGSAPVFINQMIADHKKYPDNSNWWDTYSEENEILSDFWLEQSRGHFHVVGQAVSVVLDYNYYHYQGDLGYEKVNDDIYLKLKQQGIDWRKFDKWSTIDHPDFVTIEYGPDSYVDMIYMVYRSRPPGLSLPAGGAAALGASRTQGENYLIDPLNHIYINGYFYNHGSGVILTPGFGGDETDSTSYFYYAPLDRTSTASFSEHEHGHYTFGVGHTNYGKMTGIYGVDECLSPWERISIGYLIPKFVNYDIRDYKIGDFSSRNSNDTGEVIEVPISTVSKNEFFLIASRQKESIYDKIMWGDTAHGNPYKEINPEYGKGVYIYHVSNSFVDQECADGLYSWSQKGFQHPDWSDDQNVEYYTRDSVSYDNDQSLGSMLCADGKSIFTWFSLGQKHSCLYCDGMDRVFTNKNEVWTSREFQGDRWDAWNPGYNEIFSPYSSPSTKDWQNINTGIFIWLYKTELPSRISYVKIFRTGYSGMTEESILAATPPSRPMSLLSKLTPCENNVQYPVLVWLHNMEPDMINCTVPPYDRKFYKIYKAVSKDLQVAPSQYNYLTTVNINKDSLPQFVDYSEPLACGSNNGVKAARYEITAVDGTGWESVKSDFASVIVMENDIISDNFNHISQFVYELKQNYPNPFNPETEIIFTLAHSSHVKITVYNILGEQVSLLLDDFRQQGSHSIMFNGSNLASGIYFYCIETPAFKQTKKMVLVK